MQTIAVARRRAGSVFEVATASGHSLVVEPKPAEPRPTAGPGPMELMLVSVASCAASTVAALLDRMRQPVADLRVRVDGERATEAPRVWTRLHVTFQVRGEVDPGRLERAVELTETKHCPASVMLARVTDLTTSTIAIRRVEASLTRPLRQRVLRPHQTLEELVDPGEDDPETAFFGAVEGGAVVASSAVYHEPSPDRPDDPSAWRLRSMATEPRLQGTGLGSMMLDAALEYAADRGAARVWCSARTGARRFYEERGFAAISEVYEPSGLGPHVRMAMTLDQARPSINSTVAPTAR
jgi:uncharacterized OsmC-like protein/predicted GNAT family N-acyltransferase